MESTIQSPEIKSLLLDAISRGLELSSLSAQYSNIRLNVKQAAELAGVSEKSIYSRVGNGSIPFHREAGRVFFYKSELIDWIHFSQKQSTHIAEKKEVAHG